MIPPKAPISRAFASQRPETSQWCVTRTSRAWVAEVRAVLKAPGKPHFEMSRGGLQHLSAWSVCACVRACVRAYRGTLGEAKRPEVEAHSPRHNGCRISRMCVPDAACLTTPTWVAGARVSPAAAVTFLIYALGLASCLRARVQHRAPRPVSRGSYSRASTFSVRGPVDRARWVCRARTHDPISVRESDCRPPPTPHPPGKHPPSCANSRPAAKQFRSWPRAGVFGVRGATLDTGPDS
jgi:hypothetical protein